jgi:hypothetical protein
MCAIIRPGFLEGGADAVHPSGGALPRNVILYELNEVPWTIVDLYLAQRPDSCLAELTRRGQTFTTMTHDPDELSPWRTWPTFHKSMYTAEHGSYDLGQDPETFRGTALWDVADEHGLVVGLFGPLQSWPPRQFSRGGFYVPDTFSMDAKAFPARLEKFQALNLRMTAENGFSSDAPLTPKELAAVALSSVGRGLSAQTVLGSLRHLAKERRDHRYKAGRSMMQAPISFDLYWYLHKKYRPQLSVFFTNHVAAMMHRYWGDGVPDYAADHGYQADDVFATFVLAAMDIADAQLRRLVRYADSHPETSIVAAASMGQGPIDYESPDALLVIVDGQALVGALGFSGASQRLAMHPRGSIEFPSISEAEHGLEVLNSLVDDVGGRVFVDTAQLGSTVTFSTSYASIDAQRTVRITTDDPADGRSWTLADLGLESRPRLGGGNTAYHIPEGIMLYYRSGCEAQPDRGKVDVLDVTPSILENILGVPAAPSMKGHAVEGLFR